ncbi:MAG: Cobalt-zinc-cadmium resistance protein CzcC [Bryobacteraceae bacterium]|nr:Cobalt-zinc-cadmium resistance protein CzcC [Bryobacteraceae bacterium]
MSYLSGIVLLLAGAAEAQDMITLDQAVKEAMEKNLTLAAEKLSIRVAEARQITAALRPNPVLTLDGDYLPVAGTGFSRMNGAGPMEVAARTDFVLERGGKRRDRMAVAAAEKTVAELGVQDVMRRVILDVQTAYVDIQQARENLTLAESNLKSLNGIVEINTVRVRNGDLAPVELNRSQVAALQYETAVRQAELQLRQAKTRLKLLMGRTEAADFDVSHEIRRDTVSFNLAGLQQKALSLRPDLGLLEKTEARSQADLRLQIAQGKVDYTVGTMYHRQMSVTGRGNSLGLFFSAPLPVFNRNQGEITRAQRDIEQAAARIRAMRASIGTEVAAAWQQYSTSKQLLDDIESKLLGKAADVRATTEYSYRRGEASFVEFLDAQRAFNESRQSYNEARANFARSLYLIEAVSGTSMSGN